MDLDWMGWVALLRSPQPNNIYLDSERCWGCHTTRRMHNTWFKLPAQQAFDLVPTSKVMADFPDSCVSSLDLEDEAEYCPGHMLTRKTTNGLSDMHQRYLPSGSPLRAKLVTAVNTIYTGKGRWDPMTKPLSMNKMKMFFDTRAELIVASVFRTDVLLSVELLDAEHATQTVTITERDFVLIGASVGAFLITQTRVQQRHVRLRSAMSSLGEAL